MKVLSAASAGLALLLVGCGGSAPSLGPVRIADEERANGAEYRLAVLAQFGGIYRKEKTGYIAATVGAWRMRLASRNSASPGWFAWG